MEEHGNIEVYTDDEEVIDIASKFPLMKKHGNISLLKFVEDKTSDKDFFTMLDFNGRVYVFYKFDTKSMKAEEDGGLLMTATTPDKVLEQLEWWKRAKQIGVNFRPGLYTQIENALTGRFALYLFENGSQK